MKHKLLTSVKCFINCLFTYSEEIGLMFVFSSNLIKKKKGVKRGPIGQIDSIVHLSFDTVTALCAVLRILRSRLGLWEKE